MTLSDVVRELNELRRGRGLNADDLHGRTGPRLRVCCGITDSDSPAVGRRKLVLRLTEMCGRLPDDLRLAALTALALHGQAAGQFLDRRIEWLTNHFDRDARTARRRVDQAFRLLAEQVDDRGEQVNNYAPSGWSTDSLKSMPRMDLDPPQLTEERRIVATTDELENCYPRSWMRPYYVLHPLRRCDHFSVRSRFGPARRPDQIWRLNGVPARVVDDFTPNDDLLTLDRVDEVVVEFHTMRPGFSYGLQWTRSV